MADSQGQKTNPLRIPNRFITTHDANGLSIFDTSIPDAVPTEDAGDLALHLGYATANFPVDFANQADIETYSSFLSTPPGIFLPRGSVLRIIDIRPGSQTPMHSTVSLDYGVVLEGEIELALDSGESRVMKKSDVSIQRGTDHLWRNRSQTEWARMLFVTLGAKSVEVGGKLVD